jgi:hypothetical protein
MASDNTQCLTVGDCLTKHNFGDVLDLMTLILIGSVWKYEYDRELAVFPASGVFRTSTLHGILKQATSSLSTSLLIDHSQVILPLDVT